MKKQNSTINKFLAISGILCSHIAQSTSAHTIPSDIIRSDSSTAIVKDSSIRREPYKLKPAADIPIVIGCTAWSLFAFTKIYNKPPSTQAQIQSLDINQINPIDRSAIYPYDETLDKRSYYPFYAAFPLPLVFFLTGNDMRNDFPKLAYLYLETLSVTGLVGTSATYFVNQYRPYAYTANTSMGQKLNQNAENSFFAGHVEVIATSTFFISQVYADYYPQSKIKWLFFGLSGAATAGMGYVRIVGGMHFLSDVFLGAGVGAASGILVPYFHSHKIIKNTGLSFMPFIGNNTQGLSLMYTFK
jgi:membrane-associated phospholipid phosphatase